MTDSNLGNGTSTLPRLGPAWRTGNQGGRGFQPPPAVPSDRDARSASGVTGRARSGSTGSHDSGAARDSNRNSFSVLLDADAEGSGSNGGDGGARKPGQVSSGQESYKAFSSRSEAMKRAGAAAYSRSVSTGSVAAPLSLPGKASGRTLADLAARTPAPSLSLGGRVQSGGPRALPAEDDKKVLRYTRERLLSMRPRPSQNSDGLPSILESLEGCPVLTKEAQDPVCWDTFDAEEIWAQSVRERVRGSIVAAPAVTTVSPPGATLRSLSESGDRLRRGLDGEVRKVVNAGGGGRWQRGVALPPAEEGSRRASGKGTNGYDGDDPNDLWDDPQGGSTRSAADDFSTFGGSLDDDVSGGRRSRGGSIGSGGFNLNDMSEAALKFEVELHGSKPLQTDVGKDSESPPGVVRGVNPLRPLALAGTTICSGSGDDVNVFEDFSVPETDDCVAVDAAEPDEDEDGKADRAATSASSRLMQLIGVAPGGSTDASGVNVAATRSSSESAEAQTSIEEVSEESSILHSGLRSSVPRNPWGSQILSNTDSQKSDGLDLAARLRDVAEQKAREATLAEQRLREEEEGARRRRYDEEEMEMKRRVALQAQVNTRQQQEAMQAQQRPHGHSQVELILMERVSIILENSWGRSDLMSVLQILHAEDSRVIPLLGSVDALRALIVRHPKRVALVKDPAFGAEMAVLIMPHAQWQQAHHARAQQEEQQQRQQQEQQHVLAAQKAAAARAKAEVEERAKALARQMVDTCAPWFYADPQGNVQGPFGGDEMRQWLEAGYFKGDLPISQNRSGPFRTLASLFPDLGVAFRPNYSYDDDEEERAAAGANVGRSEGMAYSPAPAASENHVNENHMNETTASAEANDASALKRGDEDVRNCVETEALNRVMAEARNRFESGGKVNANVVTDASKHNSSHQLKKLLGLGTCSTSQIDRGISSHEGVAIAGPPESKSVNSKGVVSAELPDHPKEVQLFQGKSFTPLKSSKKALAHTEQFDDVESSVPAAALAWGGAGTNRGSGRRTSMSEIQQEEAIIAARLAKDRLSVSNSSSSGWANVASSDGTAAWSGGVVVQASASGASGLSGVSASSGSTIAGVQGQPARATHQAQEKHLPKQQKDSTQRTMEELGANVKLTPALEAWCKDQMRVLIGSDDLTLVVFCMTLTDAVEIRQYLTAYLGSTPQVNSFATEFIKRKTGNAATQEQWETTGGNKKGRKKKSGGTK